MAGEILLLVTIGSDATPPAGIYAKSSMSTPIRGATYSGRVLPDGGTGPYTYAHTGGTLPAGMSLDTGTGEITGTPTTQGYYEFEVTVTDALSAAFAALFSLTVAGGIVWETPDLPVASHALAYSTQLRLSGGTAPYTFSVVSGSPPGSLGLTGPTAGLYTIASPFAPVTTARTLFTLRATDNVGNFSEHEFVLYILPPLQFTGGMVSSALVGLPYTYRLGYRYGIVQPYASIQPAVQFTVTSGSLPPGVALSPTTGVFSGTPTTAGLYTFGVDITDALGASDSISAEIYVHDVSDIDKVYSDSFGDGASATFTITHSLNIPDYVPRSVFVYDQSAGLPMPATDVEWTVVDQNSIEITTAKVPGVGAYYVKVLG